MEFHDSQPVDGMQVKGLKLCAKFSQENSQKHGVGKFENFDNCLTRKRYEIGHWLFCYGTLTGSHTRPIDPCRFR